MISNEEFTNYLKSKGIEGKCPMCSQKTWDKSENLYALVPWSQTNGFEVGKKDNLITPIIELVCNNCGYVVHFNAVTMGAIK
jgi:hypothetical protein